VSNAPSGPHAERIALVTGGAVRVGRGIVESLVAAGYRVWVHHHRSPADALARQAGILGTVNADLAVSVERARLCEAVTAADGPAGGALDVLVNSAASFERGDFTARDDDDLLRVLGLNLVAPLSLVRQLAPALRAADTGRSSCVVNIVDRSALVPWVGRLDHGVAKAGLHYATRALAAELAPLRVNGVAPGRIDADDPTAGSPRDVGEAVVRLIELRHVSGHTLVLDGGSTARGEAPRDPDPDPGRGTAGR
jgi:pteridine reductase